MAFEQSVYGIFADIQAKPASVSRLMDNINAKYNNTFWKTVSDVQPMSKSKKVATIVEEARIDVKASLLSAYGKKPLRSFEGIERYYDSLRKVGHGFKLDQADINSIEEMNLVDADESTRLLNLYRNRYDSIIQGFHSLWNSWAYMGISDQEIRLYDNGKLSETVDMRVPAANKLVATSATSKGWFVDNFDGDKAEDLQRMDEQADEVGMPANRVYLISKALAKKMVKDVDLMRLVVTGGVPSKITDVQIMAHKFSRKSFLANLSQVLEIPSFVVIDEKSKREKNGIPMEDLSSFNPNKIVLVPAAKIFNQFPSRPDYSQDTNPATVKGATEGGIIGSLTKYESDPFAMITNMEAWMFPVFKNPKFLVAFDTNAGNANGVQA